MGRALTSIGSLARVKSIKLNVLLLLFQAHLPGMIKLLGNNTDISQVSHRIRAVFLLQKVNVFNFLLCINLKGPLCVLI